MLTAESIGSLLTETLQKSSQKLATGAQLSHLVRIADPQLRYIDYGCINLRDFIRKHAPQVKEVRRVGADILYGLSTASEVGPGEVSESAPVPRVPPRVTHTGWLDSQVWKTFTNPNSPYRLYVHATTGEFRVVPRLAPELQSPWVTVPSLSADFHRQVASQFVASLSVDAQKAKLSAAFEQPEWWVHFFEATKELAVDAAWNSFRTRKIREKLDDALWSRRVVPAAILTPAERTAAPTRHVATSLSRPRSDHLGGESLRAVVTRVIQRMSLAELRALNIPLSYIADELGLK